MSPIPATIPETRSTTRRLGELLGLPASGSRKGGRRREEARALPLVAVSVRARLVADCAVTELEERFANGSDQPMDVTHTIPLPPEGAVTSFEISAGGRTAKGICKRTEEAKADFASAARRGKTAALLDSVRDDLHVVNLANVPPKTEIVVRLTIIERLRVDDGRFEYRFPTAISPKFVPGDAVGHTGTGTSPDTDCAPDASRLTPPVRLDGGTILDLEVVLPPDATDLRASIPLVRGTSADGLLVLRPEASARCRQDVVLQAWSRDAEPVVRAYADRERTLVVVDPPARRKPELECPREAVFVLDRSGSMEGGRLVAAKRALLAALNGLSERDSFEIVAFGSDLQAFDSEPVAATKSSIARASTWLRGIHAGGGTIALPALEFACIRRVSPGSVRTVLLITDGDVGNDRQLLDLTRRLDPAVRLYTIGIGRSPSAALLGRLSRLGGGTSLMIDDSQDVEAEIRRFDAALAGPMACGLGVADARRCSGRDLFAGRSATFFLEGARERVEVTSIDGRFSASARVTPSPVPLGPLWARDRVTELEDRLVADPSQRGLVDPEIADLGVRYQIQTRLTSFVAIDEQSQVHGEPISVVQPTDAPEDARVHASFASLRSADVHASQGAGAPMRPPMPSGAMDMRCRSVHFLGAQRGKADVNDRASDTDAGFAQRHLVDEFERSEQSDAKPALLLLLAMVLQRFPRGLRSRMLAMGRLEWLARDAESNGDLARSKSLRAFMDAAKAGDAEAALAIARELVGEEAVADLTR